jgi:hypothetical protein
VLRGHELEASAGAALILQLWMSSANTPCEGQRNSSRVVSESTSLAVRRLPASLESASVSRATAHGAPLSAAVRR